MGMAADDRGSRERTARWMRRGLAGVMIAGALAMAAFSVWFALQERDATFEHEHPLETTTTHVDCERSAISIVLSGADLDRGDRSRAKLDTANHGCENAAAGGVGIALGVLLGLFIPFTVFMIGSEAVNRRMGVELDWSPRVRARVAASLKPPKVGAKRTAAADAAAPVVPVRSLAETEEEEELVGCLAFLTAIPLALVAAILSASGRQVLGLIVGWFVGTIVAQLISGERLGRWVRRAVAALGGDQELGSMVIALAVPVVLGILGLVLLS